MARKIFTPERIVAILNEMGLSADSLPLFDQVTWKQVKLTISSPVSILIIYGLNRNLTKEVTVLRIASVIVAFAVLLLAGCGGNKALLVEKDAEIARLQKQVEKSKTEQVEQVKKADQLATDLNKQLADLKQKGQVWVTEKENLTLITLPNAALFASGSVQLTPEGKKAVDEIWKVLAKYPGRDVSIQGHTDNVPIAQKFQGKYKSNWELSSARAHTVLHYVMTKADAKPGRLGAAGYGEYRPLADNKTEDGRKKNRRVVIAVGPKAS